MLKFTQFHSHKRVDQEYFSIVRDKRLFLGDPVLHRFQFPNQICSYITQCKQGANVLNNP